MDRHRQPHVAQGTWRSGALHVWGWNGVDTASMAWLYAGFRSADNQRGWHDSPVSYGAIGRVSIDVGSRTLHASSVQLDALAATVWLSDVPEPPVLSDSLAWFARLTTLARRVVSAGRITPVVVEEGPFTVARWRAVGDEEIDATLAALDASKPPICTAGSGIDAGTIHEQLVDGIARNALAHAGWKAELGRGRGGDVQALRAVLGALAKPDHVVRGGSAEFVNALARLRADLERHRRRLGGEPVVVPRLRLLISDDPLEPWTVRLELRDDRDSMRWCTAEDVWSTTKAMPL